MITSNKQVCDLIHLTLNDIIAEIKRTEVRGKLSTEEVENIVSKIAADRDIETDLMALMIKHLIPFFYESQFCNKSHHEALIYKPPSSKYHVWTEGSEYINKSIEKYKKKKHQFLFWLDLDAKKHISPQFPDRELDPKAVELLLYLVGNIGNRISIKEVISNVYDGNTGFTAEHDKGKIAQHITQLNNFYFYEDKSKFSDEYLFADWRQEGLGLINDFKDKYFLFKRVS